MAIHTIISKSGRRHWFRVTVMTVVLVAVCLLMCGAVSVAQADLNDYNSNLLIYLHGNLTNSSTFFEDSSINHNAVTRTASVSINTTYYRLGGGSIWFNNNGSKSYLTVPDRQEWNLSRNFTICSYYRKDTTAASYLASRISGGGSSFNGFQYYITNTAAIFTAYNSSTGTTASRSAAGDQNWHKSCAVSNDGSITVYVDGVAGTPISTILGNASQTLNIGIDFDKSTSPMNGEIDEFAIWNVTIPISYLFPQLDEWGVLPVARYNSSLVVYPKFFPITFYDTSNGTPSSWSWESETKSTSQSLSARFSNTGRFLNLSVSNLIGSSTRNDSLQIVNSTGFNWTNLSGSNHIPEEGMQAISYRGYLWTFGGRNIGTNTYYNATYRSLNGYTWQQMENASWLPRAFQGLCVLNNSVYVTAGYNGATNYNDTWRGDYNLATENFTWTLVNASSGYSKRHGGALLSYSNSMWLLGGSGGTNDVWNSDNGSFWTLKTAATPLPLQTLLSSLVFKNKMWVINGKNNESYPEGFPSTVYYSTDGITWTLATTGSWGGRYISPVVVSEADNIMFMLGGGYWNATGTTVYYNDTYVTNDGFNWSRITPAAEFPPTLYDPAVYKDETIFLIGGLTNGRQTGDVWASYPQISQFSLSPTSGMIPLLVNFTDQSLIGPPSTQNWSFGDGSLSTLQNPSHTYTTSGTYTVSLNVSNGYSYNTTSQTFSTPVSIFYPSEAQVLWFPGIVSWNATPTLADTCNWSFGDGSTSTSCNVSHQYTIPGSYPVALNVTNGSLYNINQTSVWLMI